METSIAFDAYKRSILDGHFKNNSKGLAEQLMDLINKGEINQDEQAKLLLIWYEQNDPVGSNAKK